jgi:pimeloyl-ACP methyl ester carboxylesterase
MKSATSFRAILVFAIFVGGCATPTYPLESFASPMLDMPASCADVDDERARYREIHTAVREDHGHALAEDRPVDEALLAFGDEPAATGLPVHVGAARIPLRIVIVPGLFGEYLVSDVSPFAHARVHLETHGYRTGIIVVSGRSSSEHNARQIRDAVLEMNLAPNERVVLVGYSKGGVDSMTAVTQHPELGERVVAVVSMCSPIGGSPIADDLDGLFLDVLEGLDVPGMPLGDGGAINSLRRSTRRTWLAKHELPASIRFYSVVALTERPRISTIMLSHYDALAEIDPRNDGMVVAGDAIIPGASLVCFLNVDHMGAAMPFTRDAPVMAGTLMERTAFPREVMLESVVRMIEEDLLAAASASPATLD